jgi:hypothetical protein
MTKEELQKVEYPRIQYNKDKVARRVEDAEEAFTLGDDWQCNPDGSPIVKTAPKAAFQVPTANTKAAKP